MSVTLTIPDELAAELRPFEPELAHILELGLREWFARTGATFEGASNVLETLAGLPSPEQVLALRPSPTLESRIRGLLEKNRTVGLSDEEHREWQQYEYLEHLVRTAKAKAALKLKDS